MKMYYENSRGKKIDLSQWPIMYQEPESLLKKEWKYNGVNSAKYGGRVKKFIRGIEEKELKISILAEDKMEFETTLESMRECFETDIALLQPGRLYFNDTYLSCYIRETTSVEWEEYFYTVDEKLTVLVVYPFWLKEKEYNFKASEITTTDNRKYAYRYAYRYANGFYNANVINDCFSACEFKLIIYGPCVNPHVIINGHRYQLYIVVEAGEYITVDSRTGTVKKTINDGTIVDAFHNREKKTSIFQKIEPGRNAINWPATFDFDIILYEERSEPRWI